LAVSTPSPFLNQESRLYRVPDPLRCIEVAAGLVFRQQRLLITQRPPGGHLAGLWEFPGGKREPGESFPACLERELQEELGIAISVGEELEQITHRYPEKTVHLRFFRCSWRQHEPQALGCADFRWVTQAELREYEFPPADARLLDKLLSTPALWK